MTLASTLRAALPGIRAIPGQLGLRPHLVAVLDAAFSGDHTGAGTKTETETAVTEGGGQPPKVRWLNDEQLALAGAEPASGMVDIGPITPEISGGGTVLALLLGRDLATGETHKIRITGPMHPDGATYRVTRVTAHRALQIMVRAAPVDRQVG